MEFILYNTGCLFTSIIMLCIVLFYYKEIDVCYIFIFASLFSILWRSIKLYQGEDKIEKDENGEQNGKHHWNNPIFVSDLTLTLLGYLCVINSNQINKKFIILTFLIFVLAWSIHYTGYYETSRTIHFCGHCYIIFIFILTFLLKIK